MTSFHFVHQKEIWSQNSCASLLQTIGSWCIIRMLPSSAYLYTLQWSLQRSEMLSGDFLRSSMSLINIIKSNGLNTEPCGTPKFPHCLSLPRFLFMINLTFLLNRNELIKSRNLPCMFYLYNLTVNPFNQMLSKAFWKSIHNKNAVKFFLCASFKLAISLYKYLFVFLELLKPSCSSSRMPSKSQWFLMRFSMILSKSFPTYDEMEIGLYAPAFM